MIWLDTAYYYGHLMEFYDWLQMDSASSFPWAKSEEHHESRAREELTMQIPCRTLKLADRTNHLFNDQDTFLQTSVPFLGLAWLVHNTESICISSTGVNWGLVPNQVPLQWKAYLSEQKEINFWRSSLSLETSLLSSLGEGHDFMLPLEWEVYKVPFHKGHHACPK